MDFAMSTSRCWTTLRSAPSRPWRNIANGVRRICRHILAIVGLWLLISNFKSQVSNGRTVDVGTGSGAIALSLAAEFPEAEVFAVDVSDDALSLARENAERLGLAGRVQFLKGNLLENVEDAFDLIAANLP